MKIKMNKQGKQDNLIIGILVVMIAIVLVINPDFLFAITGNERIARQNIPSLVDPGASIQVTYAVTRASGNWGASIVDALNCYDSSGTLLPIDLSDPNGWKGAIIQKFVMISDGGTTVIKTFKAPNTMGASCTFAGTYQFGNKTIMSFSAQTMQTKGKQCVSGADTNSDGTVDRTELATSINGWVVGTVTRDKLGQSIQDWANLC